MGETDHISGNIEFMHFPLDIANPFIPDDMAKMGGDLDGTLAISGQSDKPMAEGYLILDTASVYVGAAGSTFRFDDKKIEIKNNRILFNQYGIYAYNKNPFIINGEVDFNDLSRMTANLKLTANNLQLLNVKKNEESLVYGKLFVNLNSTVRGPLDALTMRGDLQLLGGTNITYVLKDSPLTVQDRMSDMVTFTSFTDTLRRRMPRKPPLPMGGMDMLMTIHIDPAVQANVDLSPDQSNHINLEGGGDLSFQYTPQGDMFLNGRYTLTGGTIKYSIPVIPLKEFNVQEGSYVQWTGNPMDPTLNLTATERVRTSVTLTGQSSPRLVNFDVGIELTRVAIYPHRPGRHGDARGTNLERSGGTGEAGCQHARDRYVPRRRRWWRQGEHEYGRRLDQLLAKRDQQHRRKRLEVRGYQFRHGDIRR